MQRQPWPAIKTHHRKRRPDERDWLGIVAVTAMLCAAAIVVFGCDSGDTYYTNPTAADTVVVGTVWVDPSGPHKPKKPKCHDCHEVRYWAGIPYAIVECE